MKFDKVDFESQEHLLYNFTVSLLEGSVTKNVTHVLNIILLSFLFSCKTKMLSSKVNFTYTNVDFIKLNTYFKKTFKKN